MKKSYYLLSIALASTMLTGLAGFQVADAQEYVSKAKAKSLYKGPLQGAKGMDVVVKHFKAPAKFVGGKHMHSGQVFVYVLEGELTVELAGETKTFKAGELYPEDIGAAMVGKNLSSTDHLELLVFQIGEAGKPMMTKVK